MLNRQPTRRARLRPRRRRQRCNMPSSQSCCILCWQVLLLIVTEGAFGQDLSSSTAPATSQRPSSGPGNDAAQFSPFFYEKQLDRATDELELLGDKAHRLGLFLSRLEPELKAAQALADGMEKPTAAANRAKSILDSASAAPVRSNEELRQGVNVAQRVDRSAVTSFTQALDELVSTHEELREIARNLSEIDAAFVRLAMQTTFDNANDAKDMVSDSVPYSYELDTLRHGCRLSGARD